MNNPTNEASTSTTPPAADAVAAQKTFVEKAEGQLKEWSARIDQLGKDAEKLTAEAKTAMTKEIAELRTKVGAAREKLQEGKLATAEKWTDAKKGLETVWTDVKALFDKHDPKHVA